MRVSTLQHVIDYLITKPYSEVYKIMDELRADLHNDNIKNQVEEIAKEEEEIDGSVNAEHSRDE